jgi:glutathionylspermidine synthase
MGKAPMSCCTSPERSFETDGEYGEEGFVYQDLAPLKSFDGKYPVIGSWVIRPSGRRRGGRHRHS